MQNTTNYGLYKPASTEAYDTDFMNKNMDKIDEALNNNAMALNDSFSNRIANNFEIAEDFAIYVAKYGSDDNEGTENSPVLTISKAIELAGRKFNDVRLFIISSGVYEFNYITYVGNALHIVSTVPDVTIRFNKNGIFYGTHLHFLGVEEGYMTFEVDDPTTLLIYCDGGDITTNFVKFNCRLGLNGCGGRIVNTEFKHLYIEECHFTFGNGCKFTDKVDNTLNAFNSINSTIFLHSTLAFELTKDNPGFGFHILGGVLNLMGGVTTNSYKYDITYIRAAILFSYPSAWTAFKTISATTDCPSNAVLANIPI